MTARDGRSDAMSAPASKITGAFSNRSRSDPASAADRMAIVVRDEDGLEVGRLETAASSEPLSWTPTGPDGQALPAGVYSFELESRTGAEVLQTDPLETYTRIVEVRNEDGVTKLVLQGGVLALPADVTALREPA